MEFGLSSIGDEAEWKAGDVLFGRYEMIDQIGLGGMGSVWKVYHREWDRELALKMPLRKLVGSAALMERFVREAETWVGLGVHPHIVQCWYVLNISGLPCLFLDFLTGGSLKDRFKQGSLVPGQWVAILETAIQAARGLGHAHSRGVIHRDVKPENLLFHADGRVCVTDFGLVKTALPDSVVEETGLTAGQDSDPSVSGVGAYLGTPQYGAPEQWGAAERVGPAADVYALGMTLYEMCCGRRPFDKEGDNLHFAVLIDAHLKTAAPDPREFFPGVPESLAQICLACLEKEPARRPPSMDQLILGLVALYGRLTGQRYHSVATLANVENPDILNNSAVSLYSLGKKDDAREAWRRGLRLESAHPECLYNLTQLERLEGRIGMQEGLRRLQQAKAHYPLGLYCIEQGLAKEAVAVLSSIDTEDKIKKGLVQRALGDSLMYTQQYFAAEQAYQLALKLMPSDDGAQERKLAAVLGRRDHAGKLLFPASVPRFTHATGEPTIRFFVNSDSSWAVGITDTEFLVLDIATERVVNRLARLQDARPVDRVWTHGDRVVLQERGAFQLRMLPDLRLLGRKGGRVLAVSRDLGLMVLLSREGPSLFNFANNVFDPILGVDTEPERASLLAAFDSTGSGVSLLLPSGELAQLGENFQVVPVAWPPPADHPDKPTALALGRGVVYVGYVTGQVQAFDVTTRTLVYTVQLPGPIHFLKLAAGDRRLVADLRALQIVLDERGQVLWQGRGPTVIEPSGKRILSFAKGVLQLHELEPFHLGRRWHYPVEEPQGLEIGGNGALAVSWDRRGELQVWEVDEEHRVYERSLLVSPGQSFDDLVSGAQAFPLALSAAKEALVRDDLLESYHQLLKARAISGYGQMPTALDLNWSLLRRMGRDQIDAIWDRLTIGGSHPGPVDITPEGDRAVVTFGSGVFLIHDTVVATDTVWKYLSQGQVLAAQFHQVSSAKPAVLYLDEMGDGGLLSVEDGQLSSVVHLGVGRLVDARILEQSILFLTANSEIGSYDLGAAKVVSKTEPLADEAVRVFPWLPNQAIVVTRTGYGTITLGKKPGRTIEEISSKAYKPSSPVSYAAIDAQHRLLALGLQDGTLALLEANSGRLLYAIAKVTGAVTAFALLSELSVGVVATDRGYLYFWDLINDKVLDELLAHRGGVTGLKVDACGRYLITAGRDNQVRLWETSWTASLSLDDERPRLTWLPSAPSTLSRLARFFRRD